MLLHIRDKLFDVFDICMSKTVHPLFGVEPDHRQKNRCTAAVIGEAADAVVFTVLSVEWLTIWMYVMDFWKVIRVRHVRYANARLV